MELLLLKLLASYGLCFGLMNEKIPWLNRALYSLPLFKVEGVEGETTTLFERMFSCAYCTGFHTGWVIWAAVQIPRVGSTTQVQDVLLAAILFSFASSAFCYSLDTGLQRLER